MKGRPRNPNTKRKRHFTEKFRGPNLFVERWSNQKAAFIGYYLGTGLPFAEVCRIMSDGTSADTLRSRAYSWRLPVKARKTGYLVSLTSAKQRMLRDQAAKRGMTPEEFLSRIATYAIGGDLYNAIVDGDGE
jgi:hypothetical protein